MYAGLIYMSLLQIDGELPKPYPQVFVGTKGNGGSVLFGTPNFMSWVHYINGHSSKEIAWKVKLNCLKAHYHGKTAN